MIIYFYDSSKVGLAARALRDGRFTANICPLLHPRDVPETPFVFLVHLARDTEKGMKFVTRYWISAHPEMKRFPGGEGTVALMSKMGLTDQDKMEALAYEMAVHDMTAFDQLAQPPRRTQRIRAGHVVQGLGKLSAGPIGAGASVLLKRNKSHHGRPARSPIGRSGPLLR